jgi:hypothetical protein
MRPWLALLLVATLVVCATWWRSGSDVPSAKKNAIVAPEAVATSSVNPVRTTPRPALSPPPLNPGQIRARRNAQQAQRKANIDRIVAAGRKKIAGRYESEPIDSPWANATRQELMEYSLSDQIRATHSEPSNLNIDCRRTTCRIDADFPNATAADDWSTLYLTGAGSRLPNASLQKSDNADGSVHLTIYALARS